MIGRGAYGEIWLARSLTGALRAVKLVYRSTFDSDRAFQREFQGMSAFEPISRAHDGFVDILHVGRTGDYLYYIMELADDHLAGRKIEIVNYAPRTLKSELDRHKRLSASESIQLGLSLTEALDALHGHGLTHRDIKPSNIIFCSVGKLRSRRMTSGLSRRVVSARLSARKATFRRKVRAHRKPTFSVLARCSTRSAPAKIDSIFLSSIQRSRRVRTKTSSCC